MGRRACAAGREGFGLQMSGLMTSPRKQCPRSAEEWKAAQRWSKNWSPGACSESNNDQDRSLPTVKAPAQTVHCRCAEVARVTEFASVVAHCFVFVHVCGAFPGSWTSPSLQTTLGGPPSLRRAVRVFSRQHWGNTPSAPCFQVFRKLREFLEISRVVGRLGTLEKACTIADIRGGRDRERAFDVS